MKHLCIALVRFYQKFLSPLKRNPTCRFYPTCSAYAIEAFQKRGFFAGMILTVYRILRCNPFCAPGYDPVPEHGFRHHSAPFPFSDPDQTDPPAENGADGPRESGSGVLKYRNKRE